MTTPVLQAMVLADHVYQDKSSGKHVICGTFSNIRFGKRVTKDNEEGGSQVAGPITRAGSPYLYIALIELGKETELEIQYVDLSDASILFNAKLGVAGVDPLKLAEFSIPMPPLPASKPGSYSLDLLHDNEILGSWRVLVQEIREEGNPESKK